jgi:hypothetical protein
MAEPIAFPELVGVFKAARMLGISTFAVKRIDPAELPYYRVTSRGNRMYRPADVAAYLNARHVTSR